MCGKKLKCFSLFHSCHTKYGMHTFLMLKFLIVTVGSVPEKGPEQDMCVVSSTSQLPYLGTIFDEKCDISTSPVASTMLQNIIRSDERYIWVAHVWTYRNIKNYNYQIYLLYMSHISPGNRCKKEVPSRELTYTSNGKGNPFSQLPLDEICMDMLVPASSSWGMKNWPSNCPVSHPGVAVNLEDVRKKGTLMCEDVRGLFFRDGGGHGMKKNDVWWCCLTIIMITTQKPRIMCNDWMIDWYMDEMDEGKDGFIMVLKIMKLVTMMMMMMMMMIHELANNPISTLDQVLMCPPHRSNKTGSTWFNMCGTLV